MRDDLWSQWPSERVMAEDVRVQWHTTLRSVLCVCVCEELSVGMHFHGDGYARESPEGHI